MSAELTSQREPKARFAWTTATAATATALTTTTTTTTTTTITITITTTSDSRSATFQVKSSRTWISGKSRTTTARTNRRIFRYTMRLNNFVLPEQADFFLLSGMFAPDVLRTRRVDARWYRDCTLLFTSQEMRDFLANCRTRAGGRDSMFYFGFDAPNEVFQTRGIHDGSQKDFSAFLLDRRIPLIEAALR